MSRCSLWDGDAKTIPPTTIKKGIQLQGEWKGTMRVNRWQQQHPKHFANLHIISIRGTRTGTGTWTNTQKQPLGARYNWWWANALSWTSHRPCHCVFRWPCFTVALLGVSNWAGVALNYTIPIQGVGRVKTGAHLFCMIGPDPGNWNNQGLIN